MPPQNYANCQATLQANPKTWLITGVAGFIGSNLLETLLQLDQTEVGLDNFATCHHYNPDEDETPLHCLSNGKGSVNKNE